jgi:hypothetical protein
MKKLLLATIAIATMSASFGQKNAIEKYFSDYQSQEEFTKVHVTAKMFELALHLEGTDVEEQELLEAIGKIEGLTVLANETTEQGKTLFAEATKRPGREFEELMTVQDKDAEVVFLINESSGVIDEVLIIVGTSEEFAVIDIWGEIDLKQLRRMTESFQLSGMKYFDEEMIEAKAEVNFYPNPVSQGKNATLVVPESLKGCSMQIHDLQGKKVDERKLTSTNNSVNLSKLPAGSYVISLTKDNVKLYTEKMVISK